jgi:hypothetical protein
MLDDGMEIGCIAVQKSFVLHSQRADGKTFLGTYSAEGKCKEWQHKAKHRRNNVQIQNKAVALIKAEAVVVAVEDPSKMVNKVHDHSRGAGNRPKESRGAGNRPKASHSDRGPNNRPNGRPSSPLR